MSLWPKALICLQMERQQTEEAWHAEEAALHERAAAELVQRAEVLAASARCSLVETTAGLLCNAACLYLTSYLPCRQHAEYIAAGVEAKRLRDEAAAAPHKATKRELARKRKTWNNYQGTW